MLKLLDMLRFAKSKITGKIRNTPIKGGLLGDLFREIANFIIKTPWSLPVLYYVFKLVIQGSLLWSFGIRKEILAFVNSFGIDFSFMGFTVFATAFIRTDSANHNLVAFMSSVFFWLFVIVLYGASYLLYLYQRHLEREDTRRKTWIGILVNNSVAILVIRFLMTLLSFSIGLFLFFAALDFIGSQTDGSASAVRSAIWPAYWPTIGTGGLIILASYVAPMILLRWSTNVRKARDIILRELNLICQVLARETEHQFRSAVFLRSSSLFKHKVRMYYYSTSMTGAPDVGIEFEKGKGCVGITWQSGKIKIADLTDPGIDVMADWGLSKDQAYKTSHLNSILCFPIPSSESLNESIGILSIDSPDADGTTYTRTILSLLSPHVEIVGKILEDYNIAVSLNKDG